MSRYNSYATYFKQTYGTRLQKLSIDAGFGCPNRGEDRTQGGCTFCNNAAFTPSYLNPQKTIVQQIEEGISFHQRRYQKSNGYLAYFQSYTNTYASIDVLEERYKEALGHPAIRGLIIGTRPDCVDGEILEMIASLKAYGYVAIEYGIESCYDETLRRIRRGHDFATTREAIEQTARYGLHSGGHLIMGLPGESIAMMVGEAEIINTLPLHSLKLHQLQILKGSQLAEEIEQETCKEEDGYSWQRGFEVGEYVSLVCDFIERLRKDILIERLAGEVPPRYQAKPERSWRRADGRYLRNEEIPMLVEKELARRDSWQGKRLME